MSSPSNVIEPRGDRILADHRAQQRGLADAVAAQHAGDLAGLGRERHAAQRLRRAVIEADVLSTVSIAIVIASCARPRYTSITRSFDETWSMVPSASTEPSCRQVTLTPSSRTKVMSCSTTMTVLSLLISFSSSAVWWVSTSVMPATGSSTSSSFGSCASSMPISSHCFWPCDRLPASLWRASFRRMVSSTRSMRSDSSLVSRQNSVPLTL